MSVDKLPNRLAQLLYAGEYAPIQGSAFELRKPALNGVQPRSAREREVQLHARVRDYIRAPEPGRATTWVLQGQNSRGWYGVVALRRLVTSRKGRFT